MKKTMKEIVMEVTESNGENFNKNITMISVQLAYICMEIYAKQELEFAAAKLDIEK